MMITGNNDKANSNRNSSIGNGIFTANNDKNNADGQGDGEQSKQLCEGPNSYFLTWRILISLVNNISIFI